MGTRHQQGPADLEGRRRGLVAIEVRRLAQSAASASADRTVGVWDLERGTRLATLSGPGRILECVAVSPDGRWVAAGDRAHEVHVWSLPDGQRRVFHGHGECVVAVAFTPDGAGLVSVDQRGQVWTWDLAALEE